MPSKQKCQHFRKWSPSKWERNVSNRAWWRHPLSPGVPTAGCRDRAFPCSPGATSSTHRDLKSNRRPLPIWEPLGHLLHASAASLSDCHRGASPPPPAQANHWVVTQAPWAPAHCWCGHQVIWWAPSGSLQKSTNLTDVLHYLSFKRVHS